MGAVWHLAIYLAHMVAAMAAVALALWMVSRVSERGAGLRACAAALGLSALWLFAVIGIGRETLPTQLLLSASYLAWLWLLYRLFGQDDRDKNMSPIRPVVAALAFVEFLQIATVLIALPYASESAVALLIARFEMIFRLLFCIGALVLVHNLYSGASQQARQSLRWPAAAMGAMWLYDLNLFTIAYLSGDLPQALSELRALAVFFSVILLAIGAFREESELKFRPSRSFAFQSFSLLVIGSYLVVMVVIAQGISYIGSDYEAILQTGFVLVTSALALVVIPSKKLRGWLRVMLSKHLFQHRYDYRAEWLRFTDTIGRAGPQASALNERIVQAVADIADSPAGLLLVPREEGGMVLAARWQWNGLEVPAEALSDDGLRFFEESQFILDLDDIRKGRGGGIPAAACPAWLMDDEATWALVPLLHYERLVGVVVLARSPLARRLDWEDFDLLRVVGRQLASYLAEQASQDALGEAQRFDEFNRRIAFVMHDIKNLASQLSLLASNAQKHAENPAFREDMILTLRNSTDKLQALLARLGRYGAQGSAQKSEIELSAMVERIVGQFKSQHQVIALAPEECIVLADREALEQALVHLVQNAIDASDRDAPVFVDLRTEPGSAIIEIVDSGSGMSPEFVRTRLFKPFHSSKTAGFGIGAFEARELVRAMGGRLDVESREGLGTRFIIRLPMSETAELMRTMQNNSQRVA